jgi:hypothetical protein
VKFQASRDIREISLTIAAQVIWIAIVAASSAVLLYLFGTTDLDKILKQQVSIPSWTLLVGAILTMLLGLAFRSITKKASAVHGREDATAANLALLRERAKIPATERVVRSTRFGRWVQGEILQSRSSFRQEINAMVLQEGCDLRRIWNVSSLDDVQRLREVIKMYNGRRNHSIRAYFRLPDHLLPELLVVNGRGGSVSFPSTRSPHELDWSVQFRRKDLVAVMRDYFDVLWDRGTRILDAGEVTDEGRHALDQVERELLQQLNPESH